MPKDASAQKKRKSQSTCQCHCGCGKKVSERTERRHRRAEVLAAQADAARKKGKTARHLVKALKKKAAAAAKKASRLLKAARAAISVIASPGGSRAGSPMLQDDFDETPLLNDVDTVSAMQVDLDHGSGNSGPPLCRSPPFPEAAVHWIPTQPSLDSSEDEEESPETESEDEDDTTSKEDWSDSDDEYCSTDDERDAEKERELWEEMTSELTEEDLRFLRAFSFKIDENLSNRTYERMRETFPELRLQSFKLTKSRMQFLAAFNPVPYDCCINSCCCYVGPHRHQEACPYCKELRFNSNGLPRKRFMYIPFIIRLIAYYKNLPLVEKMKYRHLFKHDPDCTKDVFDGSNYRELCQTHVMIGGEKQPHKFFDSSRDIALGLSTDGFAPFKKRKQTCWPLLLFNYNLPPEIRFWLQYIICIGVIPGPKKPKDFDSFLWPAIEEFLKLLHGVRAYDASQAEMFMLRAYLILVFGDMPAMSMVMRMKGHNGLLPCRMCTIIGVRVPGSRAVTLYVPLDRSRHPSVQDSATAVRRYDAAALPIRTHAQFMEQAKHVQKAATATEEDQLAKMTGIKGIPFLSNLPSLFFPKSCPHDIMHLIFENNLPNLILLWTGKFKNIDEGSGNYVIASAIWEAVGKATAASGSTIPSAYCARPQDIAQDKAQITADAWSFWACYLGPIVLRKRFLSDKYYNHFILLVKLITLALQFEITKAEVQELRVGFQKWVQDYEKLYYQFEPERLPTCPLTVHALLHIADSIDQCGPAWAYWAFPMERFCGVLQPSIKSRRFPFANLDNHVTAISHLSHIRTLYNLGDKLSVQKRSEAEEKRKGFTSKAYPSCMLLPPHRKNPVIDSALLKKILVCLSTRYSASMAAVRRCISTSNIETWGRLWHTDGGDIINASSLTKRAQEDSRDATYVRYELLVDKNANSRKKEPEYVADTFYGQLQHILVVQVPASNELGTPEPQTLILGSILTCDVEAENDLDMHYYKKHGRTEVVDISTVQCLVGRVKDREWWVIIDRSGNLARAEFNVN